MILESVNTALPQTAERILDLAGRQKIFVLEGPLGSGKTTLIKHLCQTLQVKDMVNSPTFGLIHEYQTIDNRPVYHFDCYRIDHVTQGADLDLEYYFNSGHYCFIEWGSRIDDLLPSVHFSIQIMVKTPTLRYLNCHLR